MKTAISIPDAEFERFERMAARLGVNRSEFYRMAARRLVDSLDGEAELTSLADAVIARAGQPAGDEVFLDESQRSGVLHTEW